MEILVISLTFLVLMALGVHIGTSLGIAGVITIYWFDLGIGMLGVNFASGIASFPLLAIPFFVLAGSAMNTGGITQLIVDFSNSLIGQFRGVWL